MPLPAIVGALVLAWACAAAPVREPPRVILFVADGAGVAHWSAGYLAADSMGRTLAVAEFPVVGLLDSRNVSRLKPESASSATALATGVRTYYEAVGVGPDSLPRETVLEAAEAAGRSTGVITTTNLVDATPAAFLAHVPSRRGSVNQSSIAEQIVAQQVEVVMGDGRGWFDGTLRPDSANLLDSIRRRYVVVESGDELRAVDSDTVHALFGFFESDAGRDPAARDPSLAEMTRAALAILDRDPDGFFLLVENEHTDHSAHENRLLATIAGEVMALDDAVREALAYRERRPETLIVVLGDHETGGMSLVPTPAGELEARYGWTDHTLELVPVFAVGPGTERFGGIHGNDEIGRFLLDAVAPDRRPATAPPAEPD